MPRDQFHGRIGCGGVHRGGRHSIDEPDDSDDFGDTDDFDDSDDGGDDGFIIKTCIKSEPDGRELHRINDLFQGGMECYTNPVDIDGFRTIFGKCSLYAIPIV